MKAKFAFLIFVLALFLFLTLFLEVFYGIIKVSVGDFLGYIFGDVGQQAHAVIDARLRRALTAMLVGVVLGLGGVSLQGVLRNPLASPFTLGIQHAAALGAAVALFALGAGLATRWLIQISNYYVLVALAFAAALLQSLLVLALSVRAGLTPYSIVLISIAMSFLTQAAVALLQYLYFDEVLIAALVFWTFGDVGRTAWPEVYALAAVAAAYLVYAVLTSVDLDLLALGDEAARSSGVNAGRFRLLQIFTAAFATAVAVSFVGIIGFVGLVAGNAARVLAGGSNRRAVPLAALLGALTLVLSDLAGRAAISPAVLPVGITTTAVGAPLMIYLALKGGGRHGVY